jgi:hypothetical protein
VTFDEWLDLGIKRGFVHLGCMTHNPPMSKQEREQFEEDFNEGNDPCFAVARLSDSAIMSDSL